MARRKSASEKADARGPSAYDALNGLIAWAELDNVADEIDDETLGTLGARVLDEYKIDESSRADWKQKAERALERARLKRETKSYPWDGAANVKFPLLTTAGLQFAARAYPAIVEGKRIVKAQVQGSDPNGEKRAKADRISEHMSYQLMHEMPEWEEDTDTLLHQIPIVGCAFRKVFRDPSLGRNRSEMVSAVDLCVNQKTRSLETVPRISHLFTLYPYEIEDRIAAGVYLDITDIKGVAAGSGGDDDAPHEMIEQHRWCDLDGDGVREPWIVTVHKASARVVRIVANFDPQTLTLAVGAGGRERMGRIARYNCFVKYPFFRDPAGGFYDLGFGELLESINEIVDSTINQMLDAGHLQNAGGGFVGSGLRLKKGQLRFAPGLYHTVDAPGSAVRDAIYNMEHPGPSPVLFQLLGMMVDAGREIANVKDILTGDNSSRNATATTTLALIEQGMKVYTSIYKRLYAALKKEYKLLFDLNARHLDPQVYFTMHDDERAVSQSDYDPASMDVAPVADPNVVTDMQRMARAQVYMDVSQHPLVNGHECMRRFFEAIGAEDIEKILPAQKDPAENPMAQMQMEGAAAQLEEQKAKAAKVTAEAQKTGAEAALASDNVMQMKKIRAAEDAHAFEAQLAPELRAIMGAG